MTELEEPDFSLSVRRVTIVNLAAVIGGSSKKVQQALATFFSAVDPVGQKLSERDASLRRSNMDFLNTKIIHGVVEMPSFDSTLVPCWGAYSHAWKKLRAAYLFFRPKDLNWCELNTRYVSNKGESPRHAKPQNSAYPWAFSNDDIRKDLTWRKFRSHLPHFREPVSSALRDWLDLDALDSGSYEV